MSGIKDRLTGGRNEAKKSDASKKMLKERVGKELTKEKIDALVDRAVKEEKSKKAKSVKESATAIEPTEELLEEAEEAAKDA